MSTPFWGVLGHSWVGIFLCMAALVFSGCGPVFHGGRFAVRAYDRESFERVAPRLVIAFYHEHQPGEQPRAYWGKAVSGEAVERGIRYPLRVYWDWGTAAFLAPNVLITQSVHPGICVLAEGYWPCIIVTRVGGDTSDLPESRWPDLYLKGTTKQEERGEPVPAGCHGLWRVLLRSSDHEYDEKLAVEAYWASPGILPTLEKALSSAKDLPEADRKWAYAQLLGLVRAQLALEQEPATRTALDGWVKTLENHVEAGK